MLYHLSVQNYALIDKLEINFSEGFTIITGETGAGKSILLGALGLIVGQRADTQSLQDKTKKCVIEGVFQINNYDLKDFFKRQELDYEDKTTIRREINPEGKSRAFINDTPVTLAQLKELGERLIDIHSQHQTLTLNDSDFQLSVVDAYAQHSKLLSSYQTNYKEYKNIRSQLNELLEQEKQSKKEADYFQFQYDELETANLAAGSQEKMEEELKTLSHSEEIKSNLSKAYHALTGGEHNLLTSLNEIKAIVNHIAKYNSTIDELNKRLNSSFIELKDIGNELENIESDIVYSPQRMEELSNQLDEIYRLQQKHQVKTIDELLRIKEDFSNKLGQITMLDVQIDKLKTELLKSEKALGQKANELSANRKDNLSKIENEIKKLLALLGMPNAEIEIKQQQIAKGEYTLSGIDKVNFLFSANKGSALKELNKVASGGELSRLMLSIKSLIARLTSLPVVIFDEIDTGVSGEVADKVGNIMKQMAASMQVITITHLPQIAAKGTSHLFVFKEEIQNKTYSQIRKLTKEERIAEIAKMLSTDNPTPAAIKNAQELIG